jgi:hypothetical protein
VVVVGVCVVGKEGKHQDIIIRRETGFGGDEESYYLYDMDCT